MRGFKNKYELGKLEVVFIIIILLALVAAGVFAWKIGRDKNTDIATFAECVEAGNEVMDSFPEQCRANGQTFINVTNFEQCKNAGFPIQESFPERCSANGQTFTREVTQVEPYTAKENEIAFADLPEGLRQAITARLQEECTAEQLASGDALYSHAVASKSAYEANKYAIVTKTCGSGAAAALFAVKDSTWRYITSSQDAWNCEPLVENKIPRSFIAECFEEEGGPLVPNPTES